MHFDLTEEQELLQETVRQLLANECPATRVRELFDAGTGHDPDLWRSLGETGLLGVSIPESYGGGGLELLDVGLVAEVLGAHATPGPFFGHSLAAIAIAASGSDAQRERWLPRLATGEAIGAVALAEPGGAWQPEDWKLEAGESTRGTKTHVPLASLADVIVVGAAGGGLALIERGAGGVEVEPMNGADRTRPIDRVELDGARAERLPGADGGARLRDAACVLLAADAYGGASRCVDMSVDYAKTREQFGVTIGHFQALKHQLANMAVEVEPCRALWWYAAHAQDHIPADAGRSAAIAKAHVTDRYMQVARDSVEAHGGIGFTWECDVQIYFKRAMFDRTFLGTPAVHRERSAALAGW